MYKFNFIICIKKGGAKRIVGISRLTNLSRWNKNLFLKLCV